MKGEPIETRTERFEAIYAETMPRVLAYALRRAHPEEAKEAVAETFMIAWRRLDRVPQGAGTLPWLLATARKVLANRRRAEESRRRLTELAPRASGHAPDPATSVTDAAVLRQAFDALNDRDREVLALVAWDGLTPTEAAVVLGCSAATFSVRLHRARRRLAGLLATAPTGIAARGEATT